MRVKRTAICVPPLERRRNGCCSAPYHAASRERARSLVPDPRGTPFAAAIALIWLAAALGCGTDETAERVPAEALRPPPRILSLSRGVSEIVIELGLAAQIVGADRGSLALPQLADSADLSALDADALALAVALRPDLALFSGDAPPPFAQALEAKGIRSYVLAPRSANEVLAAIDRLGVLLGRETSATALSARVTREVSAIAQRRDGRQRLVALWLLRRDPPLVVGGTGLLHEVLELAGGENAIHEQDQAAVEVDATRLAATRADLVLDSTGAPGPPLLPDVRVLELPPELASLPAFDLVSRVARLHALLYGDDRVGTEPP
jgi:ABC-type Fe3+-hydroxamate transport system substrate-binding protein